MIASANSEQRELAHRSTNGIEVTLLWTESTNTVAIAVLDTHSGEQLEFEVDGARALDAFNHPYAYAATVRVHSTRATPLAPLGDRTDYRANKRTATHPSGPRF